MSGYSGTPLPRKLGLPASGRAAFVDAPPGYRESISPLPPGLRVLARPGPGMDFLHLFAADRRALERRLPRLAAALAFDGTLWVSWPKKASGVGTDLDRDSVRAAGLRAGLVDVKICSIDATWSGLKFVYRLEDRPGDRH